VSVVEGVQIPGEAPDDREPERPPMTVLAAGGQGRPADGVLDRDPLGAERVEILQVLKKQLFGALELVAQRDGSAGSRSELAAAGS
jgi:hypothetical protein